MTSVLWNRRVIRDLNSRLQGPENSPPGSPESGLALDPTTLGPEAFARLRESMPSLLNTLLFNLAEIENFERVPVWTYSPPAELDRSLQLSFLVQSANRGDPTANRLMAKVLSDEKRLLNDLLRNRMPQHLFRGSGAQDQVFTRLLRAVEDGSIQFDLLQAYMRSWARIAQVELSHLAQIRALAVERSQGIGGSNLLTEFYIMALERFNGDRNEELRLYLQDLLRLNSVTLTRRLTSSFLHRAMRASLNHLPIQTTDARGDRGALELLADTFGRLLPRPRYPEDLPLRKFFHISALLALPTGSTAAFELKLERVLAVLRQFDTEALPQYTVEEIRRALLLELFATPSSPAEVRRMARFLRELPAPFSTLAAEVAQSFLTKQSIVVRGTGIEAGSHAVELVTSLGFFIEGLRPPEGRSNALPTEQAYVLFRDGLLAELQKLKGIRRETPYRFALFQKYLFILRQTGDRLLADRIYEDVVFRQFRAPVDVPAIISPACEAGSSSSGGFLRRVLQRLKEGS